MAVWQWVLVWAVIVLMLAGCFHVYQRLAGSPIFQILIGASAGVGQLEREWNADDVPSGEYQAFLEKGARLSLMVAAMGIFEEDSGFTYEKTVKVLGAPDEVWDKSKVAQFYGDNEYHDKCIRYRVGRLQSEGSVKIDQFQALMICFKDGAVTNSHASGLKPDDTLANFEDTRVLN